MKGTMPATVNSREGSLETRDAEGTAVWPLLTKKSIQRLVISCDFITWLLTLLGLLRVVRVRVIHALQRVAAPARAGGACLILPHLRWCNFHPDTGVCARA